MGMSEKGVRTMRIVMANLFALLVVRAAGSLGADKNPAKKSTVPLTADEVAVYKAFLRQYQSEGRGRINVSARTFPLDPDDHSSHLSNDSECLRGIRMEGLDEASRRFHDLTQEVLPANNLRLVDPGSQLKVVHKSDPERNIRSRKSVQKAVADAVANGLLSLSDIAFDKAHRHAVIRYSFHCGSLCGHGYTLVFEKIGDTWKKTDRTCGGWIS
jgi:hypothetical protein